MIWRLTADHGSALPNICLAGPLCCLDHGRNKTNARHLTGPTGHEVPHEMRQTQPKNAFES
jgi:hypothetical protein